MSFSRWFITAVIVVVILAVIQYLVNSKQDSGVIDLSLSSSTPMIKNSPDNTVHSSNIDQNNNKDMKNFSHTITIETNKGTIVFETYDADAPLAVNNFVSLAQKGFYNNLIFHRVIKDFMIQGGDPTGTGRGGPGYSFADELNPDTESYKAGYVRGTVAMANSGPNTNGSQFFIMHKDMPLPHNYTIFGKVIKGMDIVDIIASTNTDPNDRPTSDIVMKKVTVEVNK